MDDYHGSQYRNGSFIDVYMQRLHVTGDYKSYVDSILDFY
mgnify:CR=1 FL=1